MIKRTARIDRSCRSRGDRFTLGILMTAIPCPGAGSALAHRSIRGASSGDRADPSAHARRGEHSARPRTRARARDGPARGVAQGRRTEPDRQLQGSRHGRRGGEVARSRRTHGALRIDRQHGRIGRGICGARRTLVHGRPTGGAGGRGQACAGGRARGPRRRRPRAVRCRARGRARARRARRGDGRQQRQPAPAGRSENGGVRDLRGAGRGAGCPLHPGR